jgi:hypothetical protein
MWGKIDDIAPGAHKIGAPNFLSRVPAASKSSPLPENIFKKQPTLFYKKCSIEIGKVFELC